jgi:ERF superfamily
MTNNTANTQDKQETVIMSVRHDAEALIAKAIDKNVPVETMERLLIMRRELKAEWAKAEFDKAMAAFQAECPIIKKTKGVKTDSGELAYKYAPLDSIVGQVKDILSKHGFSYGVDQPATKQGYIKVALTVKHKSGHSEVTCVELPLGNKTRIMSQTQVEAAALTFAKRYAFCNAFGILTGDEDTDAKRAPNEQGGTPNQYGYRQISNKNGRVTYRQADTIRSLLKKKGYTEDDLLKKYKVGNIAYLASEQADHIIENLKKLPDSESEDAGEQIANDAARYLS